MPAPLRARETQGARSRLQVMSTRQLDDLRVQARYARERYDLYKAKVYGPRPTSPARMRELQRECERAEARLRAAQAEERRVRITDDTTPNPSWRSGSRRAVSLAGGLGSGRCVKRARRHEGFEREHFGYQHTPCARAEQLADPKARIVQDVARLLHGDGSGGVSNDRAELAL